MLKIQTVFNVVSFFVESLFHFWKITCIPVRWKFLCHLCSHCSTAVCCA